MRSPFVHLLVAILTLAAPALAQDKRPPKTDPDARKKSADAPADGHTGAVDEETFKTMHALKSSERPKLAGKMIDLAGGKAYLALPKDAEAPLPAVIVIHEWWGLNDHVKLWADRLAADGYAALAVDLYGGRTAADSDRAMTLMKGIDEQKAKAVLAAAHRHLEEDEAVRATKTAVIGWCFGGAWALQTALMEPKLDAAVMYYGRLVTDPEVLKEIRAPLLGVFADRDASITPEAVNRFEAALTKAEVKHRILRYDADHAFANPSSARYDAKAAGAAWKQVHAFLAKHLKGIEPKIDDAGSEGEGAPKREADAEKGAGVADGPGEGRDPRDRRQGDENRDAPNPDVPGGRDRRPLR